MYYFLGYAMTIFGYIFLETVDEVSSGTEHSKIFDLKMYLWFFELTSKVHYRVANVKKNAVYNILLSVSQILFSIATFPYVSRVLEPRGIGFYTFVDNYTQYFVWVAALGVPIYGVREIAKVRNDLVGRSKVFSELFTIHLLFTVLVLTVYILSFIWLRQLEEYRSLFILGTSLLISNVLSIEWLYQGLEEFKYIACRSVVIRLIAILAIFLFVKTSYDVWLYYAINCGAVVLSSLVNLVLSMDKVSFTYRNLHLKRHLKPLIYIFSSIVVTNVYTILDSVFLGFLTGAKDVGYYTTAVKLAKILVFIITAVTTVLVPTLALTYKEKRTVDAQQLLEKSFAYVSFIGIPLSIGLFVMADPLIHLFSGSSYLPAVRLLHIVSPIIFIIGLNNIFGLQILNPMGQERLFFRASMIGMMISILGNVVLIPLLGATGAAIVNISVECSVMFILAFFVKRVFPFHPKWVHVLEGIVACLPFFVIKYFVSIWTMVPLLQVALIFILSAMTYLAIQYWCWRNRLLYELFILIKKN